MMRDVEEMNAIETAQALDITEENVKTRLYRAHKLLRGAFYLQANAGRKEAFAFWARCDHLVKNVFARIQRLKIQERNVGVTMVH
jgi:RNA polymerase sigma-70 factor (ECF subfamily)